MLLRIGLIAILTLQLEVVDGQNVQMISTPLESGVIQGGQRTGVWQYFDYPGILGLEVNYSTSQVTYTQPDSSLYTVKEGTKWERQKLKYPCRPHGSKMQLIDQFAANIKAHYELYSRADRKNEDVISVLTFEVAPDGTTTNPLIWGYKGFGSEKRLMAAYNSPSNLWLPGVKMDGSSATCRFGIYVRICPDSCSRLTSVPDSVTFLYGLSNVDKSKRPDPVSNEQAWIQFSPDDNWVSIGARLMADTEGNGILLISTQGKGNKHIPYGRVTNLYWTDNHHFEFKYTYSLSGIVTGRYDVETNLVNSRTDSTIFFERLSPDLKTLCAARMRSGKSEVVSVDMSTGKEMSMLGDPESNLFPLSWSPDQKAIIVKGRKSQIDILYRYEFVSGKLAQLPVLNAEPCGWTEDGSKVFVNRIRPYYGSAGIFSIDTRNLTFTQIMDKSDGLRFVEFSSKANQFLLLRNDNLELRPFDSFNKPVKIAKNVTSAAWSRDGSSIAYVSERGTLLSLYDLKTGRSRILYNKQMK
ncbi:MAG: hypothetical protein JNK10_05820 [Cyclobacteriaceae bacterium]|nr:hypothetical protein [Cyclobacteriaceae bacterium]